MCVCLYTVSVYASHFTMGFINSIEVICLTVENKIIVRYGSSTITNELQCILNKVLLKYLNNYKYCMQS